MKDPAFLFYPGDYLRDTQTLSANSQVAYDRIMCEHMRNICISKTQLKFFTKRLNEDEKDELMFTLTENDEGFQITWVAESIEKRRKYSESRRNNRKSSSKKDNNISKSYDEHMENENEIVNESINKGIAFEIFWDLYDKKRGSKSKIEKKWYALSNEVRQKIIEYLPAYVASTPVKAFRKDPQTFLNNEGWEDEIILTSSVGGKGLYTYQEILQIHGDQRNPLKQQDFEPTEHLGDNKKPLWRRKAS